MDTVLPQLLGVMDASCANDDDRRDVAKLKEDYEIAFRSMRAIYKDMLEQTQSIADRFADRMGYNVWSEDLKLGRSEKTRLRKNVRSCARALLPIGTEAPITFTANYRTLRHVFVMRGNPAAEFEIRKVAIKMLRIVQELAPHVFGDFEIYTMQDGSEACRTEYPKV
jgi:thymidylate synthase ThyX